MSGDLPAQLRELSAGNPMLATALINDYHDGDRGGIVVAGPAFSQAYSLFCTGMTRGLREVAGALAVLDATQHRSGRAGRRRHGGRAEENAGDPRRRRGAGPGQIPPSQLRRLRRWRAYRRQLGHSCTSGSPN